MHRTSLGLCEPIPRTISVGLEQVFCGEILGHAGAHAVYKFAIEGRKQCKPVVLIHVVGWNARLWASKQTTYSGNMPGFARCVKVMYMRTGDKDFDNTAKLWLEDDAAELVSLLDDDCDRIISVLQSNHSLIPTPLQTMGNMKRSFLSM
ncbi:hypothetical protein GGI07_002584 [Coemansia sp. Benny D115]|nr:hypothetical protein GGI07_002584 [Coemansia sp. Benny D115]